MIANARRTFSRDCGLPEYPSLGHAVLKSVRFVESGTDQLKLALASPLRYMDELTNCDTLWERESPLRLGGHAHRRRVVADGRHVTEERRAEGVLPEERWQSHRSEQEVTGDGTADRGMDDVDDWPQAGPSSSCSRPCSAGRPCLQPRGHPAPCRCFIRECPCMPEEIEAQEAVVCKLMDATVSVPQEV